MANENETVANVRDDMFQVVADEYGNVTMAQFDFVEYAVRFVAAHKREIADFQRRYDECVRKSDEADLERVRLRDEVAAKDAEILSLKSKIDEYERQPELMADVATKALALLKRQDAEIASLRALVKELADNALLLKDEVCVGCPQKLSVCEVQKCSLVKCTDALVAKAMEECK